MSEVVTQFAAAVAPAVGFVVPRHRRRIAATAGHGAEETYRKGPVEVPVLRGVSLAVRQGEFLAVVGQSGCGKTTLLHLLGTLDVPDRGEIHFEGRRIDNLSSAERDGLRNRRFGMIFQFYHLLPELTTLENVLAPLMITHGVWSYWRQTAAIPGPGRRSPGHGGPGPSAEAPPPRAFRRRNAARGHRPLADRPAQPLAGRRADGQSGPGERAGDHQDPPQP